MAEQTLHVTKATTEVAVETDYPGRDPATLEWMRALHLLDTSGHAYPQVLQTYLVSDVHLNSHSYDEEEEPENPRSKPFREYLSQLAKEYSGKPDPNTLLRFIFNGDILDITGSWYDEPLPWDKDHHAVEVQLGKVVSAILDNNREVVSALRELLTYPLMEIVYVIGNHDGLLELYPSAQQLIRDRLFEGIPESLRHEGRLRFLPHYIAPEIKLYVEHGHRLDPYNIYDPKQSPALGDVVNVLIVNRFVDLSVERMERLGYSAELISSVKNRIHDIEYLRPLSLLPLWIETVAHEHHNHPESRGKPESVEDVLHNTIAEILTDPLMTQYIVERLHIPKMLLHWVVRLLVHFPAVLPVISFFVSRLVRRTHSNKFQYRMAHKLHRERGYCFITFGHTHIPSLVALSSHGFFFNTGSWKPVINLFKYKNDPLSNLEYMTAEDRFKKVERCGILKIEKDLNDPESSPVFSLQTIQSGLN